MLDYAGFWWVMVGYGGLWWIMVDYGVLWWIMMDYGGLWWIEYFTKGLTEIYILRERFKTGSIRGCFRNLETICNLLILN